MTFRKQIHKEGQTLVELLVAIGISVILIPALLTGLLTSKEGKAQTIQRSQATMLLKEANEAVRVVRENGWATFAVNGTYHPQIVNNTWTFASGSETINGLTRSITISDVNRDANGNIATSGGTLDPSTKKVVTTISWTQPRSSSTQSTSYLTRYLNNAAYTETTQSDFNAGTKTNVAVINTSGGEIVLGAGGGGNWCAPNLSITALDLPGQGITTAVSAVQGRAYTTTGGNASGDSMDSVAISDPPQPSPPVATNLTPYNNYKTYGIYGDNSYAYLTSDHPGLTVDIVQVSNQPFTQVGTFNASGGGTGNSVFVSGNTGYVTAGNYLYAFDVTSKTGSRPQLGRVALAGTGKRVTVVGSYAYVATSSTTSQLQIIDVTNPASMSVVSSVNAGNSLAGVDVFINSSGTYAYLVTSYASGKSDFYIVDVQNKSSPQLKGNYSTNGMNPKGVVTVPGNRAIVVGSGGEQYQVVDISDVTDPERCGGLTNPNSATSVNAVASVLEIDGDAFSYILTDNASKEFQIIEGGPGGQFATSGTFISAPHDIGFSAAVNRFTATINQPVQTTITMQIAVAAPVSGSCTNAIYTYVGPDGTANTTFNANNGIIQGVLPLITNGNYSNPNRCLRYKVNLSTSDVSFSPTLYDVTFNFSP